MQAERPASLIRSYRIRNQRISRSSAQSLSKPIQPPFIGGTWSDGSMSKKMKDEKKLGQQGFTKYVKAGDGIYEKRCGKGPDVISRDSKADSSHFSHLD